MSRTRNPRRRWYQYSLRRFSLVVACIAIVLTFLTYPTLLVHQFLADIREQKIDRAYKCTSSSFQRYIPRREFDSYVCDTLNDVTDLDLDRGSFRLDGNGAVFLDVGVKEHDEELGTLVFVWEGIGWKFKHFGMGPGYLLRHTNE